MILWPHVNCRAQGTAEDLNIRGWWGTIVSNRLSILGSVHISIWPFLKKNWGGAKFRQPWALYICTRASIQTRNYGTNYSSTPDQISGSCATPLYLIYTFKHLQWDQRLFRRIVFSRVCTNKITLVSWLFDDVSYSWTLVKRWKLLKKDSNPIS